MTGDDLVPPRGTGALRTDAYGMGWRECPAVGDGRRPDLSDLAPTAELCPAVFFLSSLWLIVTWKIPVCQTDRAWPHMIREYGNWVIAARRERNATRHR